MGILVAKDTLLRLLRASDLEEPGAVRVLGVDEFALLKGHNYATILVDLEARRPIDVLPGREAETVARWLAEHPEVEIVCRDRASAYAEAARAAAPQAVQIADVWHLWNNLAKAVERTLTSHYACIRAGHETAGEAREEASAPPPDGTLDVNGRPRRIVGPDPRTASPSPRTAGPRPFTARHQPRPRPGLLPSADTSKPGTLTSCWSRPPSGAPFWTTTSPTSTNASSRAAATPASSSERSGIRDSAVIAPSSTTTFASSNRASRPPRHLRPYPNRDGHFAGS
ncbi:transposase [Streptomyces sp. IBSNAI002]|uniref:transposase n=1 Tax=Streptomyces sp. IBSNAI002 TaxID=3457500 RepID=UPI003FCF7876